MEAQATTVTEPRFRTLVTRVTTTLSYVGIVFLLVMMLSQVVDVIGRASMNRPLLGSIEIVQYCMIGVIFFCLGHIQVVGGNIVVELIVDRLPQRTQDIIQLTTTVIATVLYIAFAWAGVLQMQYLSESGSVSAVLSIADWPFAGIVAFGYAILVIVLISDIQILVERLRGKNEVLERETPVI